MKAVKAPVIMKDAEALGILEAVKDDIEGHEYRMKVIDMDHGIYHIAIFLKKKASKK